MSEMIEELPYENGLMLLSDVADKNLKEKRKYPKNMVPVTDPINKNQHHIFRRICELDRESKGGYLNWVMKVPDGVNKITIDLVTEENKPHPHCIFVTPFMKTRIKNEPEEFTKKGRRKTGRYCDEFTALDYSVSLVANETNGFILDIPDYWNQKDVYKIMEGPNMWNPKERTITIDRSALQLSVVRTHDDQSLKGRDVALARRGIKLDEANDSVLKVRAVFDNNKNPVFSDIIYDKNKYSIFIRTCGVKYLCTGEKQGIYLDIGGANVPKRSEKNVQLMIKQPAKTRKTTEVVISTDNQSDLEKALTDWPKHYKLGILTPGLMIHGNYFFFKLNGSRLVPGHASLAIRVDADGSPFVGYEHPLKVIEHNESLMTCPCFQIRFPEEKL